jgi:hypothetical protein
MAAYAVIARIDRVDPHLASRPPVAAADGSAAEMLELVQAIDLDGQPESTTIAERLAHVREIWNQTTFFLFDANSWR